MRFVRALLAGMADGDSNRGRAARLMLGTAFGQLLVLLTTPFLTRWLGPEAFGAFGLYLALLGSLSGAVSWRLGLAIPIPEEEREARATVAAGLLASVVSALLVLLAVALVGRTFAERWTTHPAAGPLLWLLPLALLGVALGDILAGWGLRHRVYATLMHQRVTRAVWTAGWQVVHGVLARLSAWPLAIGDVTGRLASVVPMAALVWRHERAHRPWPTWAEIRAALRRHRAFVVQATPANLANKIGEWIPVLLLGAWWGELATGLFVVGQRLVAVPVQLLLDSAGQIYVAEVAAALRTNPAALPALFKRFARPLGAFAVLTAIILVAIGPWGFALGLGAEWADAGRMVRWQSVALASQVVAIPLANTLVVLNRQSHQLAWDVARLATAIGVFAGAHAARLGAIETIALHSVSTGVLYALLLWMSWRAIRARGTAATVPPAHPLG